MKNKRNKMKAGTLTLMLCMVIACSTVGANDQLYSAADIIHGCGPQATVIVQGTNFDDEPQTVSVMVNNVVRSSFRVNPDEDFSKAISVNVHMNLEIVLGWLDCGLQETPVYNVPPLGQGTQYLLDGIMIYEILNDIRIMLDNHQGFWINHVELEFDGRLIESSLELAEYQRYITEEFYCTPLPGYHTIEVSYTDQWNRYHQKTGENVYIYSETSPLYIDLSTF